jgi:hypothetical protein
MTGPNAQHLHCRHQRCVTKRGFMSHTRTSAVFSPLSDNVRLKFTLFRHPVWSELITYHTVKTVIGVHFHRLLLKQNSTLTYFLESGFVLTANIFRHQVPLSLDPSLKGNPWDATRGVDMQITSPTAVSDPNTLFVCFYLCEYTVYPRTYYGVPAAITSPICTCSTSTIHSSCFTAYRVQLPRGTYLGQHACFCFNVK